MDRRIPASESTQILDTLLDRVHEWLLFYVQKICQRSLSVLIEISVDEAMRAGIVVSAQGSSYVFSHDLKRGIVIDGPKRHRGERGSSEDALVEFWLQESIPRITEFVRSGRAGTLSLQVSKDSLVVERTNREDRKFVNPPPIHRLY